MSHTIRHLMIGGFIIMTTGVSTLATASEQAAKLTIVNPKNLYDPTPYG